MKKINENTKVTLTLGQLKNLVRESSLVKEYDQSKDIENMKSLCLKGIKSIDAGISYWNDSDETEEIMEMLNTLKVKILDFFDSIPRDNGI